MPEPFKNRINSRVVSHIGELVSQVHPDFNGKRFRRRCNATLKTLELKDRAKHIGEVLWQELPDDPAAAIEIITTAIQPIPILKEDDSFDGWLFMPINSLLSARGLEAWDASMKLLAETTKRFTAEFGIRVFLIANSKKMQPHLKRWAKDSDQNLRRLVSEGTRPRLPWGEQIRAYVKDPSPILPLLELLKDDPSEYVRRSVANNLNDISKDNPERMLDVVEAWLPGASAQRLRLIRHACRGLIKQGHPRCLTLMGYGPPEVVVTNFAVAPTAIKLGEEVTLTVGFESKSKESQELIIDYRFHLVKSNGKQAPKVFKGTVLKLPAKAKKTLTKSFNLKPITTRKYYTGDNAIELLANGQSLATTNFHLDAH